jgi:hypothetical protein
MTVNAMPTGDAASSETSPIAAACRIAVRAAVSAQIWTTVGCFAYVLLLK